MNQYTVTFTIPAEHRDDVVDWAQANIIESRKDLRYIGSASGIQITKLDPKTHYSAVLAEAQLPDVVAKAAPHEIDRYKREQNSADDSSRSLDDALGQGRN